MVRQALPRNDECTQEDPKASIAHFSQTSLVALKVGHGPEGASAGVRLAQTVFSTVTNDNMVSCREGLPRTVLGVQSCARAACWGSDSGGVRDFRSQGKNYCHEAEALGPSERFKGVKRKKDPSVIRLSSGKLLVNLLQVVKQTNT